MDLLMAVILSAVSPSGATWTTSSSDYNDAPFIKDGAKPACPTHLFDADLVTASCHQEDWDRDGRWFMRLRSSGIPAHSYGQAYVPWDHLVIDQRWDITIPVVTERDVAVAQASRRNVDPREFLTAAAREDRPLGMALNGVPFFSPLTARGVQGTDTVNPLPGEVATNDTLFDKCAGSLQTTTGAYGYRVMPPCLHGDIFSVSERGGYDPALALIGFGSPDLAIDETLPPESPLLGFAMDGRRLYGPFDATRSLAWGLDVCNGRWEVGGRYKETTGRVSDNRTYTYRATPEFPYLIGCPGPAGQEDGLEDPAADPPGSMEYTTVDGGFIIETPDDECPAGSYLSVDSGHCTACHAGTFGKDPGLVGQGCPGVCPRRYYCPEGTATPILRCPVGTFGAAPGMGHASCSGECQAGYFCLSGSTVANSNECGAVSYFCPQGSGERKPASVGHYTTPEAPPGSSEMEIAASRRTRSGQLQCEPGTYCAAGVRRFCPPGTFGATAGLAAHACSGPCPAGSYCPEGSAEPIPCPPGRYGDMGGLSTVDCSGLCARGHYCPAGSTSAFQEPCPARRFGAVRGLGDGLCAEEHVCARVEGTPCLASLCDAGYYCPPGSTSPRANACGSSAYFCPRGSAFPSPVDVGHYTYSEGDVDKGGIGDSWSLAGQSKTHTSQAKCEPGYYCLGGARIPCPAGTFGSSSGLSTASCSGQCPAGYVCRAGLSEALRGERCGGAQFYCPTGSASRLEVGIGNYTVGGPPDRRIAQEICPTGTYCLDGVRRPCPAGTHGYAPGLSSSACSGSCPAGRYCPQGTAADTHELVVVGVACPAGRYGGAGMASAACAGPCEAGYYCPAGSEVARAQECGSGKLYCPEGSGAPAEVNAGWYATGGTELTRTGQAECMMGKTPPSAAFIVDRCPDNTVGWNGTVVNNG